jgi:hypothetical protein
LGELFAMYDLRNGLGVLKGMGAVLPLILLVSYLIGECDRGGSDTLIWLWASSVAIPTLGMFLGVRCNGRKLTVAAIVGFTSFCIATAIFLYEASRPIVIPPYP